MTGTDPSTSETPLLTLEALSKTYRGAGAPVAAISQVNLALEEGEIVGIQGPSGSGKSTLLLIAGGILAPDSGRVQVRGSDLYAMSRSERARFRAGHIAFVFQQFHLVPYLRVLDNVLLPSLALPLPDAGKRAVEAIARVGLDERLSHFPSQLSVGEQQRVAFARALLQRPSVILADEPTGNLDAENARVLMEHLAEFARDGGAVLLVTHDRSVADRAHRVLRLEGGRLDGGNGFSRP